MKFVFLLGLWVSASAFASGDHTLYYAGIVHWTSLSDASVPADQDIVLKKQILPSQGVFVESATMLNYRNEMCDAETVVIVKGTTVTAKTSDGNVIGTGLIRDVGPNGDFSYLEFNLVVVPTGTTVRNINYITPTKLIARKEIRDSSGRASLLWESDLRLISEEEYSGRYQKMSSSGKCR